MPIVTELKERNIWSTLAVYMGGGWVVIEAINFITNKYLWPDIIIDITILVVIFGLPAVLIHTWYHGQPGKQQFQKKELFLHGINTFILLFLVARLFIAGDYPAQVDINSQRSIAVLPFKNLSQNQENQFFADGVIEAVRNHLGKINDLWVTSGNSTEQYRNSSKTGSEIATELGVAFMLSGSIQRYENHIRIIVELSDTKLNKQIWTEVFDRQYKDLFELQSDIAFEIANRLNMKLSKQETSLINKKYTKNLDAYVLYLEGQGLIRTAGRSFEEIEKAAEKFNLAIGVDNDFSLAYVGLANTYLSEIMWGRTSPKEIIPLALETIMKAMEIDNSIGESYQILGLIKFFQTDFVKSEKYLLKAITLNPNDVESYVWLANLYALSGNLEEASSLFNKAIGMDPSAINYRMYKVSSIYYYSRDYKTGISELKEDPEIDADHELQWILACLYYIEGNYKKSIETFRNRANGKTTNWAMGYVYGVMGETDSARYVLNYLLEKRNKQYVPGYMIGCVYVSLGDYDNAFKWFDKAFDEGPDYQFLFGILYDPRLDSITKHPRLIELREKIKSKML